MNSFERLVAAVVAASPLQKKRLDGYLAGKPDSFFKDAEDFASRYLAYLAHEGIELDEAVNAYVRLCNQMMRHQVRFAATGQYPATDRAKVYEEVYANPSAMKAYMIGLAMSLFLWETHYEVLTSFRRHLAALGPGVSSYLEVGPGHGVFLSSAAQFLPAQAHITAVDISATSINITRSVMRFLHPDVAHRIQYEVRDFLRPAEGRCYDFVTMGEVLEHLNEPRAGLRMLHHNLTARGHSFVSTCVDCPAVDHLWHFKNVDEIRDMLRGERFTIQDERVLPVEKLPMHEICARRLTINYCALLRPSSAEAQAS